MDTTNNQLVLVYFDSIQKVKFAVLIAPYRYHSEENDFEMELLGEYRIQWSDGCRQEQDHSVSYPSIQAYGLFLCVNYTQKHPESESQHAPSKPPSCPNEPGPLTPSNPHWQLGKVSTVWCRAMLAPCERMAVPDLAVLYVCCKKISVLHKEIHLCKLLHYTNQTLFAFISLILLVVVPLTWIHYHFQGHIHSDHRFTVHKVSTWSGSLLTN